MRQFDTALHTKRGVEFCALLGAVLALLALWSWGAGIGDLLLFSPADFPMAPHDAALLGLLGVAIFALSRAPGRAAAIRLSYGIALVIVVGSLLAIGHLYWQWRLPLLSWFAMDAPTLSATLPDQMLPLTVMAGAAASVAFLLALPPVRSWRGMRWLSGGLALLTILACAYVLARYVSGHLPRHGHPTPMPLWTALTLLPQGLALLGLSLTDEPTFAKEKGDQTLVSDGLPLAIAGTLAVLIGLLTAVYLRHAQERYHEDARALLQAIGDLKAEQISSWRNERMADARFFARAPFVSRDLQRLWEAPTGEKPRADLLSWLNLLKGGERYQSVTLFDTNLVRCLEVAGPEGALPVSNALLSEALRTNEVIMTDLHREPGTDTISLQLVFAIRKGDQPLGVLLLSIDPREFLFPLIRTWPTPSHSSEAVLGRREGAEVVFLNDVRYQTNTALSLRFPLTARGSSAPAAMAAMGQWGVVDGIDYRGVPVLASSRPIPDSTWFVVAKTDRAEVFGPLRRQAWLILELTAALAIMVWFGVAFVWGRRLLALEQDRLALAGRFEHLMKNANDIVLISDENWRILEASHRAAEILGWSVDELRQRRLPELRVPAERDGFSTQVELEKNQGYATYETTFSRQDGTTFPVEVSLRAITINDVRYHLSIARDITQRREHEREIERLNRLYATLSGINKAITWGQSREQLFNEVCRVTAAQARFQIVWIGWLDKESRRIVPVAKAGDEQAYVDKITVTANDEPAGRGPVGTCIRRDELRVCNDFHQDPCTEPWRQTAVAHGIQSMAAFPIHFRGQVCGAFAVYSREREAFQDKEVMLLAEAARDISFGLDNLDRTAQQQKAELARRETEAKYRLLAENAADVIWILNVNEMRLTYVSPAAERLCDYTATELLTLPLDHLPLCPAEIRAELPDRLNAFLAGTPSVLTRTHQVEQSRKDGSKVWVEVVTTLIRQADHRVKMVGVSRDITERKQAEQTIRQSEAKFRSYVQHAPSALFVANRAGRFLDFNDAALELIGVDAATLRGMTVTDIHPKEGYALAIQDYATLRQTGHFEGDRRIRRHDGKIFWVAMRAVMLDNERSMAFCRDITERRHAEEALREREAQYRAVIETSADGFWISDIEGRFLEVNDGYVRLSGYSREELLGMRISDVEAVENADQIATHIMRVRNSGSETFETLHRARNGTIWQAEVTASYWPIAGGRFFAFVRDIHQRKRSEALLRTRLTLSELAAGKEFDKMLRSAVDATEALTGSEIGFFHFIGDDQETLTKQTWSTNTLAMAAPALMDRQHHPVSQAGVWADCIHSRQPVIYNDQASVQHQKGPPEGHLPLQRTLIVPFTTEAAVTAVLGVGNKPVDYTARDVEAVKEILSMVMDMVARTQAELSLAETNQQLQVALTQLRAAQQQMVQQERMHALGQMATGIAHDFNNSLSPVLGFADLLLEHPDRLQNREQALRYLRLIKVAAQDAAQVVRGLREFYRRREQGEVFLPVQLTPLVRQTIELTRPRWEQQATAKGISIRIHTELEEVPTVYGNEGELREALINLIFNAVDSMPNGGTLTLRTRAAAGLGIVDVMDTGTGMSETVRQRCLEPFFTTKGDQGTGLGLSMVHGIVRRHDGKLDIQSELGKGSTFTIRLPLSLKTMGAARTSETLTAPMRILAVDDDATVRDLMSDYLQSEGHAVDLAHDGVEALTRFMPGKYDVVITDQAMPGLTGEQVAKAIKQHAPQTRIILLTGFGDILEAEGVATDHIDLVLTKPVTIQDVRQALLRVMSGGASPGEQTR